MSIVRLREHWMINRRRPGFLALAWFGASNIPSLSPVSKLFQSQSSCCRWSSLLTDGGGCGGAAKSYNSKNVGSSTNLSILSSQADDPEQKLPPESFMQCCGSGMFIPDADFFPSRISDPQRKKIKNEGGHKLQFWNRYRKNLSQFTRNF